MLAIDASCVIGTWDAKPTSVRLRGDRLVVAGRAREALLVDARGGAVVARLAHLDGVNEASFSPDGALVATASADMGVRLWSAGDGARVALGKGHSHGVTAVAWSPDGKTLASGSLDGTVRLWDPADLSRPSRVLRAGAGCLRALAWAPDGVRLAAAADDGALVLDVAGERQVGPTGGAAWLVAWAPDGSRLAVLGRAGLTLRQPASLAALAEIPGALGFAFDARGHVGVAEGERLVVRALGDGAERAACLAHEAAARAVAALPGGGWATGGDDTVARLHDEELRPRGEVVHPHVVISVDADGGRVVSASRDGAVRVWEVAEAAAPRPRRPAPEPLWAVVADGSLCDACFSPDGDRVAASGKAAVELRDASTGALAARLSCDEPTWGVTWTRRFLAARLQETTAWRVWEPGSHAVLGDLPGMDFFRLGDELVATRLEERVRIHRVAPGLPELATVDGLGWIDCVARSPDGRRVVVTGRDAAPVLLDLQRGGRVAVLGETAAMNVVYSPDGALVLTSGQEGIGLWRTADGGRVPFAELARGWMGAWSPRGDRIALATNAGPVHLFAPDGRRLAVLGGERVFEHLSNPTFSADGGRLTAWHDRQPVRIWDAQTGAAIAELRGHASDHLAARWLRGGDRLLSWSQVNRTTDFVLKLWDGRGGPVASLAGHSGDYFFKVTASPDEEWLATIVWDDGAPRAWRVEDGAPYGPLGGHEGQPRSLAFAPAGPTRLLTLDDGGGLRMWAPPGSA